MKKVFIVILLTVCVSLSAVTIYDLQYTEEPGNGTYPSPYLDLTVTVSGIVTCNNYAGDKFFIAMPEGGAWKGILVYHATDEVNLGDEVQITAQVTEYYGLTELQYVLDLNVLSSGNPLPPPALVTTDDLNTMEAYEGVLVTAQNAAVTAAPDQYDVYKIDDGSGECQAGSYCLPLDEYYFDLVPGLVFSSISGCVTYSWGNYELTPRLLSDLVLDDSLLRIALNEHHITENSPFFVPLQAFAPANGLQLNSFSFQLRYDSSILQLTDVITQNSLLQNTAIIWNSNNDLATFSWNGDIALNTSGELCFLEFQPMNSGSTQLAFSDFYINDESFTDYRNGFVSYFPLPGIIADELTLIQKPILSVPAITTPGSEFEIICAAPENTSGWTASLEYNDIQIDLNINDVQYNTAYGLYTLSACSPLPDVYTLYDLSVNANGISNDTARNAVSLIPEFKDDYYFIHITDTHLPGHEFFGNDPAGEDFSEMDDLRYVIETINLLNPEFVLLTGDVVNEGELEDFNDRHQFSLAKNLLSDLEVPVYITAGNHDIGGWNDTDPPPGTARHNWHRFFGWEFLENGFNGTYTQNYSFTYDNTLFIGIEAYDNYDSYLYNIFGDSSFTAGQMNWLQQIIADSDAETKVAFYHFDFDEEISLSYLGLDMALWGHIHSNSGDINQHPYNLATEAVCDENRAFRTIFVADNQLFPQYTSYVQDFPEIYFTYPNNGNYSSNSVTVHNDYNLDFSQAEITFKLLPASDYAVDYGDIKYIIDQGNYKEIAVSFLLPAEACADINIFPVNNTTENIIPAEIYLKTYPNPANPDINIEYTISHSAQVEVNLYNLKGQHISTLLSAYQQKGSHHLSYTPKNISSGIYFLNISTEHASRQTRLLFLK